MKQLSDSINRLTEYCQSQRWVGYDPYDGLNSKFFQSLPFFNKNKLFRMAFLQLHKRSCINLRPLFQVPKGRNPKGIGLFLLSYLRLYQMTRDENYLPPIHQFIRWLKEDISSDCSGAAWGYHFPWQSRAFFLPPYTPTVVNTSYIGRAFLQVFRTLGNKDFLQTARSACTFILKDLNRKEDLQSLCFSYSPRDRYFVHNATALASSLLALTYRETQEKTLLQHAQKSISCVASHQREDGSWPYGEDPVAQKTGTDHFHTGFILESLKIYRDATGDTRYQKNLQKGLEFYQKNFFLSEGQTKYFPKKTYPLDIHCASQAVLTLVKLQDSGADTILCDKVVRWMICRLQDKKGFFYYQKTPLYTNKIPYMRWGQAWALLALVNYLYRNEHPTENHSGSSRGCL